MNEKLAREIVAAHADALRQGYDVTDRMAQRYPDLAPLLRIARGVNVALAMVPVSLAFRTALHEELLVALPVPVTAAARSGTGWVLGGVALGSAATGLAVLLVRRMSAQSRPAAA